jgi:predicted deacetylase
VSSWLKTVTDALDCAEQPVRFFFRDDDAGWQNDRLYGLLDEFAKAGVPIDLAVIPAALDDGLTKALLSRWQLNKNLLGLHQHGYSHSNHEQLGRKCEFGNSRTKNQQKEDIAQGQKHLLNAFGDAFDPIFTPPWNRCTQDTVECLEELGFQLLSRDVTAVQLASSTLCQAPVHVDWSKIIKTPTTPLTDLGQAIANNLLHNDLTGIMLHHADMDTNHLQTLAELLANLSSHHNAQGLLLRDALGYIQE